MALNKSCIPKDKVREEQKPEKKTNNFAIFAPENQELKDEMFPFKTWCPLRLGHFVRFRRGAS